MIGTAVSETYKIPIYKFFKNRYSDQKKNDLLFLNVNNQRQKPGTNIQLQYRSRNFLPVDYLKLTQFQTVGYDFDSIFQTHICVSGDTQFSSFISQ